MATLLPPFRALGLTLAPIAAALCLWRLARKREHPRRFLERFGRASLSHPNAPLVWLHGASIGEATSLLPLAQRLLQADPRLHILFTSATLASAQVLSQRMMPRCRHQFIPYDYPGAVSRFLSHWRPSLAVLTESELWPHLILTAHSRNIPLAQIGACMSARSFRRWRRFPRTAAALLACFSLCIARDDQAAKRLAALRRRPCDAIANLKEAAPPLPFDAAHLAALQDAVKARPLWLATNTHPAEHPLILRAHAALRRQHPDLLLLLAPRHPNRPLPATSLKTQRHSANPLPQPDTQVHVIDSFGELGLFYRAAPLVFLGGSLVDSLAGHNPLEPARLNCLVLHGIHLSAYSALYAELDAAAAGQPIESEAALVQTIDRLLRHPELVQAGAQAAGRFARARGDGILDQATQHLLALMHRDPQAATPAAPAGHDPMSTTT